jgi:hypothetical protein
MRYANTHERAFHKCLNDFVKARNESKKLTLSFESASRLREKHDMAVNFHKLEYYQREWKNWAEKSDWELARKRAGEEYKQQNAAKIRPKSRPTAPRANPQHSHCAQTQSPSGHDTLKAVSVYEGSLADAAPHSSPDTSIPHL